MKSRLARLGVLLAAVLGLMATMVPSAQATTVKTITFTGFADLSAGLGYPCTPAGTTNCTTPPGATVDPMGGPKNDPEVTLTPGGNNAGFVFNSAACVKLSVSSIDKPNPKAGLDLCTLFAAGTVSGFCGLSTGLGVATLTNTTGTLTPKAQVTTDFKFTGVGGVLHVTGGDKATNIYAEVSAIPQPSAPGGPSCTNKTGNRFLLSGEAVYKDCTGQVSNTGVCDPT